MNANDSACTTEPKLFANLMTERLLYYRRRDLDERIATTLPELFVALTKDQVRDFPALRPHQRHVWHAFLVHLGAIALHQSERTEPFNTAQEWHAALMALTPDDGDGAAWCLISPVNRPAFMQAPVLAGLDAKWETKTTPDQIDVIKASKNHDIKSQRMSRATVEDWVYALVSLQTQSPSDSGSYKESSRMDGGWGRRPGVGIIPPGAYGRRWYRDIQILLTERGTIAEKYCLNPNGLALVWLKPWDGSAESMLSISELDPFYIEVTRRLRIARESKAIVVKTTTTPASRINPIPGGLTGDIWSPIGSDRDGPKVLTVRPSGLNYKTAVNLLVPGKFQFSPAMKLQKTDPKVGSKLRMESIAWGAKNTNAGYHIRDVRISKKLAIMLAAAKKSEIDELALISKSRVEQIGDISWMLKRSLKVLFGKGSEGQIDKKNDAVEAREDRFCRPFEDECDAKFFPELIEEIESNDRDVVRTQWLCKLADRAEHVLRSAFLAGPRCGQLRYRSQSAALGRLHGLMRSDKSKLPALAQALKACQHTPFTSAEKETHEYA
jgi:CRISPR system Cascade subunit CasA